MSKTRRTGTKEWSEHSFNISLGCPNRCLYGYCAEMAARYKRKERSDWGNEELTENANIQSFPKKSGVIMFPTVHDITPFNVAAYIRVALLMLKKGNRLLITTKARLDIMDALTTAFEDYKGQILFRITIGNMNPTVTEFWEPGAPTPFERLRALALAQDRGFETSVSVEPMLGGVIAAMDVERAVRPYVTESVWIGKMNQVKRRVDASNPEIASMVKSLQLLQSDEQIIDLYRALRHNPKVRWKDSIREVLANHGIIAPEA